MFQTTNQILTPMMKRRWSITGLPPAPAILVVTPGRMAANWVGKYDTQPTLPVSGKVKTTATLGITKPSFSTKSNGYGQLL